MEERERERHVLCSPPLQELARSAQGQTQLSSSLFASFSSSPSPLLELVVVLVLVVVSFGRFERLENFGMAKFLRWGRRGGLVSRRVVLFALLFVVFVPRSDPFVPFVVSAPFVLLLLVSFSSASFC